VVAAGDLVFEDRGAFGRCRDGLAVHHLGLADVHLQAVFGAEAVRHDLEVQLAHAGDDGLARIRIIVGMEGGILVGEFPEHHLELLEVGVAPGLHRHGNHGFVRVDALQQDGVRLIAEGVAGAGEFEPHHGHDVARLGLVEPRPLVGVQLEDPRHALRLLLGGVVGGLSHLQPAGVDAQEAHAPTLFHHHLEHIRAKGFRRVGMPLGRLAGLRHMAPDGRHVQRRREVGAHAVEQRLNPLVAQRGAAEHRHQLQVQGGAPDGRPQLAGAHRGALEEALGDGVVVVRQDFHQTLAVVPDLCRHSVGHRLREHLGSEIFVFPDQGVALDQVHHAIEPVAVEDGQLERQRHGGQLVAHLVHHGEEIGAGAVQLVNEGQPRHVVLVRLVPDRLGLRLHATHRAEDHHRAVQHPQAALHLDGEIHVARGVDELDLVVAPRETGDRRRDGDAALLLLDHPVHGGGPVVDFADAVDFAAVVENPLRHRRLAGVDVGDDADVACFQ